MGSTFEEILSRLVETQSPETCLTTLIDLKEAVESDRKNIAVLQKGDYLKYFMNTLDSSQKAIIDISLGIFSSCTLNQDFARKAMEEYNLPSQLHDLISRYPREESAKEAIFRILGNICEHGQRWVRLILQRKPGFVTLALELLKNSLTEHASEETCVMALRFLRILLRDSPYKSTALLVLDSGVMKVVCPFFIEMILKTEINENILKQTNELIYTYSQCDIHYAIDVTITGESILYVCNKMRFFLQRIPRIMANIKIDRLKSGPLLTDMCDWIIQKVEVLNIEDSKDEYVGYISGLCFMLLEIYGEQLKKYLPHLIKVLKFIENPAYADTECFILIVMTFNKYCSYNPNHVQDLMDCGIIQLLIEKLKWVSGKKTLTLDFDHQMNESYLSDISKRPHALGSCNHPNPRFRDRNAASSSNENEEKFTESELRCACSDEYVTDEMKETLQNEIVDIFQTFATVRPKMPELASEEFFTALVSSSVHFGRTQLYRESKCKLDHLIQLMNSSVIEKIHDMHQRQFQHTSSCAKCMQIRDLASNILEFLEKSAMTKKSMAKIKERLITDRIEQKAGLILTIPCLFREKSRIAHFLLQFDCLKSLAQLLKDGSSFKKRTIKVLHTLAAKRLAIADPTQVDISKSTQETTQAPVETAAAENRLVTFKLDDGSTIQADRDMLTNKSWYFSALLEGQFRESKEEEVALQNTPIDLLRFMLQLLERPEKIDQLVMDHDLVFLFDAFVFIDRHGQSDLCSSLMSCIRKYKMNPKTVAAICRWSIQLKLDLLRMDAVTFASVHNFEEDNERVVLFDSLLDMGCTEEMIEDIQTMLEGSLRSYMRDSLDDFEEPDFFDFLHSI